MRLAILGDVHANLQALEAVLADVKQQGADRILQVGDLVGYGAHPEPCLDLLLEVDCTACLGNHDEAVAGRLDLEDFNEHARAAVVWTQQRLTGKHMDQLASLPRIVQEETFTLVHSSLHTPASYDYLTDEHAAARSFIHQSSPACFIGHSHVPAAYLCGNHDPSEPPFTLVTEGGVTQGQGSFLLVNAGSVGQPRDGDPRASYVLFEPSKRRVEFRRIPYDIRKAQESILAAGLPSMLAARLSVGM